MEDITATITYIKEGILTDRRKGLFGILRNEYKKLVNECLFSTGKLQSATIIQKCINDPHQYIIKYAEQAGGNSPKKNPYIAIRDNSALVASTIGDIGRVAATGAAKRLGVNAIHRTLRGWLSDDDKNLRALLENKDTFNNEIKIGYINTIIGIYEK